MESDRREFLKTAGLALGAIIIPRRFFQTAKPVAVAEAIAEATPQTYYLSLWADEGHEVMGASYARYPFIPHDKKASVTWPTALEDWGEIRMVGLGTDDGTDDGGELLFSAPMGTQVVCNGDHVNITITISEE